jgi:hypothetical protein
MPEIEEKRDPLYDPIAGDITQGIATGTRKIVRARVDELVAFTRGASKTVEWVTLEEWMEHAEYYRVIQRGD